MIELFYVDGHLTNLILFPIFTVVLFFIIRFIELVDNYDNIPYITPQLRCKKCNREYYKSYFNLQQGCHPCYICNPPLNGTSKDEIELLKQAVEMLKLEIQNIKK